jgi:hypothetical protein
MYIANLVFDIEHPLVGREGQPVRVFEIGHLADRTVRLDADDRRRLLLALGERYPEPGVGEIDAAVGFADEVVRPVEPLALEPVDQHLGGGEFAVRRPAGQTPVAALADDQPALRIEGRAVALAGILAQ